MLKMGIRIEGYKDDELGYFFFAEHPDSLVFEGREFINRLASGFHFQICLGRVEGQFCLRKTPSGFTFTSE